MTTYTLTFNQTFCQSVSIQAKSKEEYKEKSSKLISFLESLTGTKSILIDDQVLDVKTEYVVIDDIFED